MTTSLPGPRTRVSSRRFESRRYRGTAVRYAGVYFMHRGPKFGWHLVLAGWWGELAFSGGAKA